MDEDDEQTMQMAADIARNRRSVELRRRHIKVSTTDGFSQTVSAVKEPINTQISVSISRSPAKG